MVIIFFILATLLVITIATGFVLLQARTPSRRQQLLVDLGLKTGWSAEKTTPFYMWGWRKQQEERVWAERIVRTAFEEVPAWLSPDDLAFFEQLCDNRKDTQKITLKAIETRIDQILDRSDRIVVCARLQLAEMLKKIAEAPDESVRTYFSKKSIPNGDASPRAQYGRLRLSEWMNTVAREMVGLNSEGWNIHDWKENPLFFMSGLDAVRFWATVCKANMSRISVRGLSKDQQRDISEIKGMSQSIFHDYIADIQHTRELISQIEQIARERYTHSTIVNPEQCGIIFCHWLYTPEIPFTRESYCHVRDFFSNPALSASFKMLFLEKISQNYDSLNSAAKQFSSKIIFYGKHQEARDLAINQYHTHLLELRNALASIAKLPNIPPEILVITSEYIGIYREQFREQTTFSTSEIDSELDSNSEIPREYLPYLIDSQKKKSMQEHAIDESTAEAAGWLINVEVDDFTAEEYAHLDKSEYKNFLRICCDQHIQQELFSETNADQDAQNRFLDKLLTHIVSCMSPSNS